MDFLSIHDKYQDVLFKVTKIGDSIDDCDDDGLEHGPLMVAVFLENTETHTPYIIKISDAFLNENGIKDGDLVYVTKGIHWILTKAAAE